MSSICAATLIDEDKISCTIYLVLKTTVKNTVMQNRREVWNDTKAIRHLEGKILFFVNFIYFYKYTFSKEKCVYLFICLIFDGLQ